MRLRETDFDRLLGPVLADVENQTRVADSFIDKELYQIYIATLWAQIALSPAEAGVSERDLEALHEHLNQAIAPVLGRGHDVRACYQFVNSRAGEQAMTRHRVPGHHRDLLLYFCSIILDPEGHRRWAEEQRKR
jgi:hypothetical protein